MIPFLKARLVGLEKLTKNRLVEWSELSNYKITNKIKRWFGMQYLKTRTSDYHKDLWGYVIFPALLVLFIALLSSPAWAQDIPQPVRDTSYDWRCVHEDGTVISNHQRLDTAQYNCQLQAKANPGVTYYFFSGRYRVFVDGVSTPPPVVPPEPEPEPEPEPVVDSVTPPDEASMRTIAGTFNADVASAIVETSQSGLAQGSGRWQVRFTANQITTGGQGLVSRDAEGVLEPGHAGIWLWRDAVHAWIQHDVNTVDGKNESLLRCPFGRIAAGQEYTATLSFGSRGLALFVDGQLCAHDYRWRSGTSGNNNPVVVGSQCNICVDDTAAPLRNPLDGTAEFMIFNNQAQFDPCSVDPEGTVNALQLILPAECLTGSAQLSWTHPTQYEDNAPLPIADLDATKIYAMPENFLVETVVSPASSYVHQFLAPGEHCYEATAVAKGVESVRSNQACQQVSRP